MKNLAIFRYFTHDFMDEEPEENLRSDTPESMQAFIKHMRESGWSGTISEPEELTAEKLFEIRNSEYWKGCEEQIDKLAQDGNQAFVDTYNRLVVPC